MGYLKQNTKLEIQYRKKQVGGSCIFLCPDRLRTFSNPVSLGYKSEHLDLYIAGAIFAMELGERNANIKKLLKENSLRGSILQSLFQIFKN